MKIFENNLYIKDLQYLSSLNLPWYKLKDKSIMISGSTGMIGSLIIDVIMRKNIHDNLNCKVYALGRSVERMENRFSYCFNNSLFTFINYDVNNEIDFEVKKIDYILHLASNTHPLQYATDPIGTITTNILGLKNILDFACIHETSRILFASSNEIYGENRGDVERFNEEYCGYINCNTLRAGYTESKRCGEALCQAYIKQKKLDIVISRITRTYGPSLLNSDSKALSQFIHKAINNEDIILKSSGTQFFSYLHATDTVAGIFYILLCGERGESYNISDEHSDIMLRELATYIADFVNKKVIFEIPDEIEKSGYSKATNARLDGTKLKKLGWKPIYDIRSGITNTLNILKSIN